MKDRKDGLAMSVRAERKLQSQQAILEQVLKLSYAGQCFNSISLRQLAQAVGMVPSAFYRYFPNKEQLAAELVDQTSLIIKSHLVQIAESCRGDVDLLCGRYVVDAKSMLGVFSLPTFEQVEISVGEEEAEFAREKLESLNLIRK